VTEPRVCDRPPRMLDHWWWRPGWRVGRPFYMWYVTFDGNEAVRALARAYERRLALPTLDVVPPRWLHLTTLGVGFVDEVEQADADRIADAARRRLARCVPITVRLGPAAVYPEAVRLEVTPAEPVVALRGELRAAVADVWGDGGAPAPDEAFFAGTEYVPHVSLAYSNGDADLPSILDALRRDEPAAVTTTIRRVDLVAVHRDTRMYEWTTVAFAELGHDGSAALPAG
jgi:2'-5' RNA ligase